MGSRVRAGRLAGGEWQRRERVCGREREYLGLGLGLGLR